MAHLQNCAYHHKPLEYVDSMRFLELFPGIKGSPLRCSITEARKSDEPLYEALSYAWGEPVFSHTIEEVPSGTHLSITVNLYDALQSIRDQQTSRVLWVDAICINQLDLEEKGHQVAQMGRIYEDAERVVVWLGLLRGAPGRIICVLEDLVQSCERYINGETSQGSKVLGAMHRMYTLELFDQPWYSRVWIVQEFVLARELQFVTCHDVIPTRLLYDAVTCLLDMHKDHTLIDHPSYPTHLLGLYRVAMLLSPMFNSRQNRTTIRDEQANKKLETSSLSLASCLIEFSKGRECKDARDYLYAMLALAEDNLGITPDYTLSFASMLNDFAKRSLCAGELSILHASGVRPNHGADLASFVPSIRDWANTPLPLNAPQLQFSTATNCSATITTISTTTVSIRGTRVDRISRIGGSLKRGPMIVGREFPDHFLGFKRWLGQQPRAVLHQCSLMYVGQLEPYRDNHFKDYLVEQISTMGTMVEVPKVSGDQIRRLPSPGSLRHTKRDKIVQPYMEHRKVLQTSQGYLGVGPFWMKPDDQVVTFDGGATPYILRKVISEDGDGGESWQLVGDCFLLGWMKGDYFGHTVVDEISIGVEGDEEKAGSEDVKYLVREFFTLV